MHFTSDKTTISAIFRVFLITLVLMLGMDANAAKHTLRFFTNPDYVNPIHIDRSGYGLLGNGDSIELEEGETVTIDLEHYAYSYEDTYQFVDMRDNHGNVWTDKIIILEMGKEDIDLTVNFQLDIPSPGNPKSNSFEPESGILYIEDFTPGNLSRTIEYAVDSDNMCEVRTIKVYGQISDKDVKLGNSYSICEYFSRLETIDLSATTGATYVPEGCIYGMKYITNFILPASIDSIGERAFYGCRCIQVIKLNSTVPPKVTKSVFHSFNQMADHVVFEVPALSIDSYQTDEEWSKVNLVPSISKVARFLISLPNGNMDGRFRNCVAELSDLTTGIKIRQTIGQTTDFHMSATDTLGRYMIRLSTPGGRELGCTEIKCNRSGDYEVNIPGLKNPASLAVKFITPGGDDVTDDVNITWAENGVSFGAGTELCDIPEGLAVTGRVELGNVLSKEFAIPDDIHYTASANGTDSLRIQLLPLEWVEIKGRIVDIATSNPIPGADVTLIYSNSAKKLDPVKTVSDSDGYFTLRTVDSGDKKLHVSALGYEDLDCQVGTDSSSDFGMKMIAGSRIYLDVTRSSEGKVNIAGAGNPDIMYEIKGNGLPEYKQQSDNIVFYEYLAPGTAFEVTARSLSGKFIDVTERVTIDESGDGYAMFNIVDKGSARLKIHGTEYIPSIVILYDSSGRGISKVDCNGNDMDFRYLDAGIYSAVVMERNGLYNNYPTLFSLSESPLVENIDYVKSAFEVRDGIVVDVDCGMARKMMSVPSTVLADGCYLMSSVPNATQSKYITLNAKILIEDEFIDKLSSCKMEFDIPDGIEFLEGSIVSENQKKAYVHSGKRIIVPVNSEEVIKMVFRGIEAGDYRLGGIARMQIDGQEITEPLPETLFSVYPLQISVPDQVAINTVVIKGSGTPDANVSIYDDNVLLGETRSNRVGDWEARVLLSEIGKRSYHNIRAKAVGTDGVEYRTQSKTVIRDLDRPILKRTVLKYQNSSVIFDHVNRKISSSYYTYKGQLGYYDYTFLGEFECANPEKLENVRFEVTCHDNSVVNIPAVWDAEINAFKSDAKFVYKTPLHIPVYVSMTTDYPDYGNPLDEKERIEHEYSIEKAYLDNLKNLYSFGDVSAIDDRSVSLDYTIGEGNSRYKATVINRDPDELDAMYPYTKVDPDSGWKMAMGNDEDGKITVSVWKTGGKALTIDFGETLQSSSRRRARSTMHRLPIGLIWAGVNLMGDMSEYVVENKYWDDLIDQERSQNEARLKQLQQQIFKKTKCGTYQIADPSVRERLQAEAIALRAENDFKLDDLQEGIDANKNVREIKLLLDAMFNVAIPGVSKALSIASKTGQMKDMVIDMIDRLDVFADLTQQDGPLSIYSLGKLGAISVFGSVSDKLEAGMEWINKYLKDKADECVEVNLADYSIQMRNQMTNSHIQLMKEISNSGADECDGDGDDPDPVDPNPDIFPVGVIIDPSGYVYEGTEDNRIEGVKATAWYLENGQEKLWDAAEYGQNNPLFTDNEGHYEWDVPVGLWKVKFQKDGYLDAESEWLPVPPPQMDVNIEMVSLAAPEIVRTKAYTDRLEFDFDRFVDVECILVDGFSVVSVDGRKVEGVWEATGTGNFCNKFIFTPDSGFSTEYVRLTVDGNIKSKAGVKMGEDFMCDVKVEADDSGIENIPVMDGSYQEDEMDVIRWQHNIANCPGADEMFISDLLGRILVRVKGSSLDTSGIDSGFFIITAVSKTEHRTLKICK